MLLRSLLFNKEKIQFFFGEDIKYRVKLMLYELYENHVSNINKPDYLRLKGTHKERIVENLRTLQLF